MMMMMMQTNQSITWIIALILAVLPLIQAFMIPHKLKGISAGSRASCPTINHAGFFSGLSNNKKSPSSIALDKESSAAVALLSQAVTDRKAKNDEVREAMEFLEKKLTARKGGPSFRSTVTAQGGQWEVIYSSLLKQGYMPGAVCEIVKIEEDLGATKGGLPNQNDPLVIRIDTTAGPLPIGSVVGDYVWEASENKMVFSFDRFELGPLRFSVPKKPKSYAFFYVNDQIACARSSAGGVTLLRRALSSSS